jgi:hypothetical protein
MTKSTKASPKADTAIDYDGLLRANAKRVFSEPDVERRLTALKELWAEDGVLVENEHVVAGREAVSGSVGTLLKMLPPGTTFEAEGPAAGHHGLGRLRWRAVDSSGKPLGVTGTDIAFVEDGRIAKLYVILDPS